jgi:methylmalonyl-CoA mutase N-terminal domain/subunit
MDIETRRRIIVGVNAYQPSSPSGRKVQILPERIQNERVRKLTATKRKRDTSAILEKIELLRSAAQRGGNMLPAISEAARAGCTVGEMSDALRDIYGVYKARHVF